MEPLIDTHAHLSDIEDLERILEEARSVGIIAIISVSSDLKTSIKNLEITQRYGSPKIFPSIGIHPQNLNHNELEEIKLLLRENKEKIVAIGEIGLDFWYKEVRKDEDKRILQKKIFATQLDLAREFNLGVIIHSRGTWKECLNMVLEKGLKKAIFHWYSGDLDTLEEIIKNGYFISAAPSCGYSREHREAIKNTPLENILLETDSPTVYKDFQSEPKDILRVLKEVAVLKGVDDKELARLTKENAIRFFNLST